MKYLKAFENDNWKDEYLSNLNNNLKKSREESDIDNSAYYKPISHDLASDTLDKSVSISNTDIERIKPLFSKLYIVKVDNWVSYTSDWSKFEVRYLEARRESTIIRIWEIEDEYYLVQIGDANSNVHFICDQIEGLIKLLEKTLVKI